MAAISECDACGKQAPMIPGADHNWHKPKHWFERSVYGSDASQPFSDFDSNAPLSEILTACSRECIDKLDVRRKAEGKPSHAVILPF